MSAARLDDGDADQAADVGVETEAPTDRDGSAGVGAGSPRGNEDDQVVRRVGENVVARAVDVRLLLDAPARQHLFADVRVLIGGQARQWHAPGAAAAGQDGRNCRQTGGGA